ncbi:MAG TPA: DUF1684 domain-containing protein [Thermoanaerobaculia bacterium]|nr:DUF1684 domain-containing protein [Thermoanaerobaculia bacterium]
MSVAVDPEYRAEIEAWRVQRLGKLTAEDGWLALAGLHWLEDGDTSLGSAPECDVVLPPSAPPRVGDIRRRGAEVRLALAPGITAVVDGGPVAGIVDLKSDAGGEPTVVRLGDVSFQVLARGERLGLRIRDAASPARREPPALDYFPIDPAWRVRARLDPYDPPHRLTVADYTGGVQEQVAPGALVFEHAGEELRLDAFDAGEELFVIFADPSNASETYGAGRYLYTARPDHEGAVWVDFNKAYSPPCAFTPFATCPLPPPQNRLSLRVAAGEKFIDPKH